MRYFKERKTALIVAVIVSILTILPYLIGFISQGEEWRFTGFVVGVEDGNSYLAKMLSGAAGSWLFRSPYSSSPQKGVIAFLPYILLGKITSSPAQHEQLIVVYQLFRIVGIFLAVLASWDFICIFISKNELRIWALIIAIFGGGLGWIVVLTQQKHLLGSVPLEFISPESFGFLALLGFPHLAFARGLFLWGFTHYLQKPSGFGAGVLWLLMGFFQPMMVVIGWAVIGTHNVILSMVFLLKKPADILSERRKIKKSITKLAKVILVSAPIVIYTAWAFLTDPYLTGWAGQNNLPSPHIFHYLVAYGLMLPAAIFGLKMHIRNNRYQALFLIGWLLILPVLLYAPVPTQRRLAEGVWVAIVVSVFLVFSGERIFTRKWKVYLLFTIPSSVILLLGSLMVAISPAKPVFRPVAEVQMFRYFELQDIPNPVILSSYEIGNPLPAWVPARVVLGHGPESTPRDQIEKDLETIFSAATPASIRNKTLQEYQVDYLIWTQEDRDRWLWDPREHPELRLVYNERGYSIYALAEHK